MLVKAYSLQQDRSRHCQIYNKQKELRVLLSFDPRVSHACWQYNISEQNFIGMKIMSETTNTESTNPESTTAAPESSSEFEQYQLSEKWLKRFKLLKKLGADSQSMFSIMKTPEFKGLSNSDRISVSLNFFVLFFGPLYYLFKKMWMKAGFMFASIWVFNGLLSIVEGLLGFTFPSVIFWVVPNVICAQIACYDYYKHITAEEKIWPQVPEFLKQPVGIISYLVASFVFLMVAVSLTTA
ncbi:hypothetical protein JF50_14445 [Pseudoalteromonas luteoviolacea]|uniref:DUF2628 domain-containing protein n=2 Tax=Pseudoalteromonas luteoviolacea TaxID=43657 RepID=A0A0C1QCB9_9GAMM|nr:hypothetical protein JF50_14445 [Pseudoalteromonas luteoviolacea]